MNGSLNHQIIITGVGGQGVLFITRLLAQACMAEGKPVLTSETHGMAQRGGTVISHLKVGNHAGPLIRPGHADLLVALKSEGFDHHFKYVKRGGQGLINASENIEKDSGFGIHTLDADALCLEDGQPGAVNLYMLGGCLALVPLCSLETLTAQVEARLKNKEDAVKSRAVNSLKRGYELIS